MKKALFYTPYLHILGGGEQHLLSIAKCLSKTHQIYFVTPDPTLITKAFKRFNFQFDFNTVPVFPARVQLRRFDLTFFVSNGSVPFIPLSRSHLYFMSPFKNINGRSFLTQLKLKFISQVFVNSKYAKTHIDQEFKTNAKVIYPAIKTVSQSKPKKNLILSVGRFTPTLHQKNQTALIKAFIRIESKLPGWRLVLAGGTEAGSKPLLQKLKKLARNHRIDIKPDISKTQLESLYFQAQIFWHATGYNKDIVKYPQQAEHFGIVIVEAMSHAIVPLAFNAGGPQEIITHSSGLLWDDLDDLVQKTLDLTHNPQKLKNFSQKAKNRAKFFNSKRLCQSVYEMVKS